MGGGCGVEHVNGWLSMVQWLINNLGLKILALALATALWFYVQGELARVQHGSVSTALERVPVECVEMPIHPHLKGEPARGYRIEPGGIVVEPSTLLMAGSPRWLLHHAGGLWTEPIDMGGARETVVRQVRVMLGDGGAVVGSAGVVTVTVPIERR